MKGFVLIFLLLTLLPFWGDKVYGAKNKLPVESSGYVGTLPDLSREYEVKDKDKGVNAIPSKDFNSENEIKPAPNDNPAFVNIILKKDKTSKYVNELNEFITLLENIYDLIDENSSVQLFNAKVYYFNKSVELFRDKYENKPEGNYISYKKLVELSLRTHSVAQLRAEAQKYNPYLAYGGEGYVYNPNNIQQQLDYLKNEIQQTILVLRETN